MPPKAGKGQDKGSTQPVDDEQQRLQDQAFNQGLTTFMLKPAAMARADGRDIVKKSTTRKNRYLLVFNCQIAPAAAGKVGTLAKLDTRNPVLYFDFPEGRLKLLGTLAFPRNKYMVLKLGPREALCEDVLESMIVFSETRWVGIKEKNPEEKALPMPPSLSEQRHEKFDFNASRGGGGGGGRGATQEIDEAEEEEEEEEEPASQRPQRASARATTGKRQRYNEDSDADEEEELEDEPEGGTTRKLPKLHQGSQQHQQRKPRQQAVAAEVDDAVVIIDGSPAAAGKGDNGKQGTLDLFLKKPAPGAKGTAKQDSKTEATPPAVAKGRQRDGVAAGGSSKRKPAGRKAAGAEPKGGDDVMDLVDGSSGEDDVHAGEEPSQPPSSTRPRRAAAGAAAKRLRIESETEDEQEEGSEGGGSGSEAPGDSSDEGGSEGGSDGAESEVDEGEEAEDGSQEEGSDYVPSD
ncbi:hypothetical protein N2152v2_000306 [Parachlorella kessleri]